MCVSFILFLRACNSAERCSGDDDQARVKVEYIAVFLGNSVDVVFSRRIVSEYDVGHAGSK